MTTGIIAAVVYIAIWLNNTATASNSASIGNNERLQSSQAITNTSNNANFTPVQTVSYTSGATADMRGESVESLGGMDGAKPHNLWITLSSDQRFIANTNTANANGNYGNWTVFACADITEAAAFLALTPSNYFDNMVINTHGCVMPPTDVKPADPIIQTCIGDGYYSTRSNRYMGLQTFKEDPNNADIKSLRTIFSKVKSGGTAILSSCETGGSEFQDGTGPKPSKDMLKKLYQLGGSRFDILATRGYAKIQTPYQSTWGIYNPNSSQFSLYNNTSLQYSQNQHGYIGYIGGDYNAVITDVKSFTNAPFLQIIP